MKVYKVFVACPGDVAIEAKAVDQVVERLNRTSCKPYDVMFTTFRWNRDSMPDFGSEAQQLIEKQAIDGNKMDAAIFILWHRYGTPTGTARSGWESEFKKFALQHASDPTFRIMFFVKSAKVNPRSIDAMQLTQVNEFLVGLSGLYAEFKSPKDFERRLEDTLTDFLVQKDKHAKNHRKVV